MSWGKQLCNGLIKAGECLWQPLMMWRGERLMLQLDESIRLLSEESHEIRLVDTFRLEQALTTVWINISVLS